MHREIQRNSSPAWIWVGAAIALATAGPAALASGSAVRSEAEKDKFSLGAPAKPVASAQPVASAESPPSESSPAEEQRNAESGWSYSPGEGMRWNNAEGDVEVKLGGRVQLDWVWHTATTGIEEVHGSLIDGVEFRGARLFAEGTLYGKVGFKAEYDFAGGEADFKDVWMSLHDVVSDIDLKVGHFKEPQGLEQLTSAIHITFLERGLPDALVPGRNTGAMVYDTIGPNNINWAVGVFRETNSFGDDVGSDRDARYNFTGRLTGTPLYSNAGADMVHLGTSFSYRSTGDGGIYAIGSRPENHQAPTLIGMDLLSEKHWTAGFEAAWVMNALSLQGEYMLTRVDAMTGDNPDFMGGYLMLSYFLTGEHRPYRPKSGAFGRVMPKNNWGQGGGGAWELALRYSRLDLNDSGYRGGELDDITVGANWYLNPNARIMFNYVFGELDGAHPDDGSDLTGETHALLVRFQVDF